MAVCDFPGCLAKATHGVEIVIDAGSSEHPGATIPGDVIVWCEDHEEFGVKESANHRTRKLSQAQLRKV